MINLIKICDTNDCQNHSEITPMIRKYHYLFEYSTNHSEIALQKFNI